MPAEKLIAGCRWDAAATVATGEVRPLKDTG